MSEGSRSVFVCSACVGGGVACGGSWRRGRRQVRAQPPEGRTKSARAPGRYPAYLLAQCQPRLLSYINRNLEHMVASAVTAFNPSGKLCTMRYAIYGCVDGFIWNIARKLN